MGLWIFSAFTAANVVCVLIVLTAVRKSSVQLQQVREIVSALSGERGRIAAHDAEIDQITATLRKLSGRIGAVRKEQQETEVPEMLRPIGDSAQYKAKLRARLGIVPGKPAPRG